MIARHIRLAAASLSLLFAATASAQGTAKPAAAQPPPSTYRTEDGLTLVSACQADGKFATLSLTPAFVPGDDLTRWFGNIIKSRLNGWGSGMAAEPVIRNERGVLTAETAFTAGSGQWRAWFYAVARGNRAQWAMVLTPPGMAKTDARVVELRSAAMELYGGSYLLLPESYVPPPSAPPRPANARNDVVARLASTGQRYAIRNGPVADKREYRLMRDGYVFEFGASDPNSWLSSGTWTKDGDNYKIGWGVGSEVISGLCARKAAAPGPVANAKPGCRMVPKTITTSTLQSRCDAQGRNCTMQSVPQQTTVMQEQCG